MPELPEVQTITTQLQQYLVGKNIKSIKLFDNLSHNSVNVNVVNEKLLNITRVGKAILIELTNQKAIGIHLKMTGQLLFSQNNTVNLFGKPITLPNKHTKAQILFTDNSKLFFNDIRRFGWIKIDYWDNLKKDRFFVSLGKDALVIQLKEFLMLLKTSERSIRDLLLDQSKIAGIGNIYVNDALFLAKINPFTKSSQISKQRAKDLYNAVKQVLKTGVKLKGTSKLNFVDLFGKTGNYQNHTLVYDRENQYCVNNCGAKIKRLKLKGRSSFFCPVCQR
ncbi:MAG: formamidopyrimidine-DNA glycosylase [Patescibacteria group bacterium]|nr:MAG: formamidopyrimidine-DNA glycosylase [Patescibacteria group bacterium]